MLAVSGLLESHITKTNAHFGLNKFIEVYMQCVNSARTLQAKGAGRVSSKPRRGAYATARQRQGLDNLI